MGLINIKILFIILYTSKYAVADSVKKSANVTEPHCTGGLFPRETETREVKLLDGMWKFSIPQSATDGCLGKKSPAIHMPVPSSYNDVTQDASIRDYVGTVCYERRFRVPMSWSSPNRKVWLRFSSVSYAANVTLNGHEIGSHKIGHLPFQIDITDFVRYDDSNLLTVAVDNVLSNDTIPQGHVDVITNPNKQVHLKQSYSFDFFNYAGIHRKVFLHSTPKTYIEDINITTSIQGESGLVTYKATFQGANADIECKIQIYDKNNQVVAKGMGCMGTLQINDANFWWPYLMHSEPGYLYTLKVSLKNIKCGLIDTYYEYFGIREIKWTDNGITINDKPLYFRGFGMHEDSELRGKGWDPVLWVKNFNLLQWVGANSFRTSHYPYAEEIYQLADELGIMIIDECPSVDTEIDRLRKWDEEALIKRFDVSKHEAHTLEHLLKLNTMNIFGPELLANHQLSLTKMINRDKNHPSVVMWSIANEPRTQKGPADDYFKKIAEHVRAIDTTRPITFACNQHYNNDKAVKYVDIIAVNHYWAWYDGPGQLMDIVANLTNDIVSFNKKFKKPVLMSEYGGDAIVGFHSYPEYVWSEDYQTALLSEHFKAFDELRQRGFFVGEFIWNFADFNTPQAFTRAGGNKKGIFTRNRQPKASAHLVRARYNSFAKSEGIVVPDTSYYVFKDESLKRVDLY